MTERPANAAGRLPPADDLYRALVDAAPDALIVVDAAGTIRVANRQAEVFFGYTQGELIGSSVEMLVPDALRARHVEQRGLYAADPRTRHMASGLQLTARHKDGTAMDVDIALSSIETPTGRLTSAAIRDLTERIEAERERQRMAEELIQARLRQAQRLESVGQLAGGIAHDFNNLLAVILNYADFLAEQLPPGEMKQDVEEIQKAASRAAELTRQLLIFARREVVKAENLDLNAIVRGVEKLLRRTIGEHVEFVTTLAPELPSIRADPGQVEQIFMNLAVNARDAMPAGGRLAVETSEVVIDDDYADATPGVAPGRYVRLAVSDTGIGMDAEIAARAFEPFFTTKPAGHGTGLGLSTVYGIVTQAGGSARIYSEPGRGTSVSILLPAIDQPAVTVAARGEGSAPAGQGETVLVVEDESAVLLAITRMLTTNGYLVLAHASPEEALAVITDLPTRVDLLMTDVVMPGMSGIDLARRGRELRPNLRVVFMSGYSHDVIDLRGATSADRALLQKPFTRKDLLRTLHDALSDETS